MTVKEMKPVRFASPAFPFWRINDYGKQRAGRRNYSCLQSSAGRFKPGFPRWIGPAEPKAAEMLAKLPTPSFTRRVRHDSAT
jgi:hypothetical protein